MSDTPALPEPDCGLGVHRNTYSSDLMRSYAAECVRAALAAQAEASAKALEMAQAVAAADNTLHGAIDYWQNKAGELRTDLARLTAERDCRLCANYTTKAGGCVSVVQCVDSMQFRPTAPRQYWIAGPNV